MAIWRQADFSPWPLEVLQGQKIHVPKNAFFPLNTMQIEMPVERLTVRLTWFIANI